jgi:hypothetical protein
MPASQDFIKTGQPFGLILKFVLGLCLIPFAYPQAGTGKGSFAETGIFLKNFHFDWESHPTETSTSFSIDLKKFSFGFKDFSMEYIDEKDKQFIQFDLKGPELLVDDFELNVDMIAPDWISIQQRIRIEKWQAVPLTAIQILSESVDRFLLENERYPKSFTELAVKRYVDYENAYFDDPNWIYEVNVPENITATPTQFHPWPDAQVITLDWPSQSFNGAFNTDLSNIPDLPWKFKVKVDEITQTVTSKTRINYSPMSAEFDYHQLRGSFQFDDFTLSAIPEGDLMNLAQFEIPAFLLQANQMAFTGSLSDSLPIIHQGKGKFRVRNVEMKIPERISKNPEIEKKLEKIGIWNNALQVKLLELNLILLNEQVGEFQFTCQTPFFRINLDGEFLLHQHVHTPNMVLHNTELRFHPISLGLREMIKEWERKNGQILPRQGATIVLKIDGPLDHPTVHGLKPN